MCVFKIYVCNHICAHILLRILWRNEIRFLILQIKYRLIHEYRRHIFLVSSLLSLFSHYEYTLQFYHHLFFRHYNESRDISSVTMETAHAYIFLSPSTIERFQRREQFGFFQAKQVLFFLRLLSSFESCFFCCTIKVVLQFIVFPIQ